MEVKRYPRPATPGALSVARGGLVHALRFTGSRTAYCGWRRFNYNKLIDMKYIRLGSYEYVPPTNVYVTCLHCLVADTGALVCD